MTVYDLDCLYRPKSVAVVGASENENSISGAITQNVVSAFKGSVDLINPNRQKIFGRPCLASIETMEQAPDLAVVTTPADAVLPVVEDLARFGTRSAVVITDPKRGSQPGIDIRRHLFRIARETGMRINGPNCLGISTPAVGLHATMARIRAEDGNLAFFGQSATAAGPIMDWAHLQGLGFSHVISLGDMVDVDYADVLFYLADDPYTRVIILYAERLSNTQRFMSAARHAAQTKPVIILKAGALSGDYLPPGTQLDSDLPPRDRVYDAAFRRAGVLRVRTLGNLFDAVEALSMRLPGDTPSSLGERLAILANGESIGTLAMDSLLEQGGNLASLGPETIEKLTAIMPPGRQRSNPVDILPDATGERYAAALSILMEDKGIDAVLVLAGPTGVASGESMAKAVADVVEGARRKPGKRRPWIGTSWPGGTEAMPARKVFAEAHIATFDTPSTAVSAFHVLNRHRRICDGMRETPVSIPGAFDFDPGPARQILAAARARGDTTLSLQEAAGVLSAYGLLSEQKETPETGGPSPIIWRIATAFDPEFGPIITFGLTGAVAPLIDRGVVALPPLTQTLARDVILSHAAGARLFAPLTESPEHVAAFDHLALALMQISQMLVDLEDLGRVVLDPVRLWPDGARWGGALVTPLEAEASPRAGAQQLAIKPFPKELERDVESKSGLTGHLRPIRPEDEPALGAFQEKLSDEDIRLRFFRMIRKNDHAMLVGLTQIDYAWHMAFVLTGPGLPGEAEIYGVVRLVRDHTSDAGEYAVVIRSDMKGHGLGRMLMEEIIRYGRTIGLDEIYGLVLAENRAMLGLAQALGFEVRAEPDDPTVVRTVLPLC